MDEIALKRRFWLESRFHTYVAGRCLINQGEFLSGDILLAYAVEFSLKQLASEYCNYDHRKMKSLGILELVKSGHDLVKINDDLSEKGILRSELSGKLLKKLTIESKRYPSEKLANIKDFMAGKLDINIGDVSIPIVDSLVLKIDDDIFDLTKDSSMYIHAWNSVDMLEGHDFFAYNLHAWNRYKKYKKILKGTSDKGVLGGKKFEQIDPKNLFYNNKGMFGPNYRAFVPSEECAELYHDLNFGY